MSIRRALAPAKVNLFLHVGGLAPDGYHPIRSLMSFADIGDQVSLDEDAAFGLEVVGAFAPVAGPLESNLVARAARAFFTFIAQTPRGALMLDKQLPAASGLGGGSSDAGASLRLLREAYAPDMSDRALEQIAAGLGADGAACLWARPVLAEGRGEQLRSPPPWPRLDAVLVNPAVPSPTGAVYRAYDAAPAQSLCLSDIAEPKNAEQAAAWLASTRNDLEAAAIGLEPAIGEALSLLRDQPESLFARMSGSGASLFALCADAGAASQLAARLEAERPGWWVRACRLG